MSISFKKHQLVFLLMLAVFVFALFYPNFSFAQSGDAGNLDHSPITRGLCNVFGLVSGNIGKAIAIFAIIAAGFGFFTGKFSIALVIGITLGIGILFGAPKIIAALTGEQVVDCDTITAGDNVACLSDIRVSANDGLLLSTVNYNSITKSFTLRSEPDDLAKISCYRFSSDQIRVHFTPLVSSTATRTADTSIFTAGGGLGTLPATAVTIPLSGNLALTDSAASATPATLVFNASAFCPHVELAITFDSGGTCPDAGSKMIAYAAIGAGSATATALCVSTGINTTTIASGNITHSAPLRSGDAGGKFIIKAGFFGDKRRHNLFGSRYMIVTCAASGLWDISTTPTGVTACSGDCMNPTGSPLNFNFQDR